MICAANVTVAKEMAEMDPKSDLPPQALHHDIDQNLKRVYEDALQQELPDRFKVLLAQLRAGERSDPLKRDLK